MSDFQGVRRLGLFGGSYDPVHIGHLHVAHSARERFGLERIVFVPAAIPPHKPDRILASGKHRMAMLELAVAREPDWSVCGLELERQGPSYTIDTVRELPGRLGLDPDCQLFLLLGSDNLPGLAQWYQAEALLRQVQPIVVHRGEDRAQLLAETERLLPTDLARRVELGLLDLEPVPISSSEIRQAIARGEDPAASLPPGVLEYIQAWDIYAADA